MNLERAFSASILTLALWGITALLLTGEFHFALILVCYALVMLAFFSHSRGLRIRPLYINLLTITVFILMGVLAVNRSLLDASIYFFIFLEVMKLLSNRNSRDTLWIYVIVFFQIIGAAVLTTSLSFAIVFVVYIFLQVVSSMLFTMRKGMEATARLSRRIVAHTVDTMDFGLRPAATNPPYESDKRRRVFSRDFVAGSVFTCFFVLVVTLGFFMLVPRLSTNQLFQNLQARDADKPLSAFDENIEFGAFDKISLDASVAMYVRPVDLKDRPNYVRLRGVSLDTFDGKKWRRTTAAGDHMPFEPFARNSFYPFREYMMIQPPGVTNFLFGDSFPVSLKFNFEYPVLFDAQSNSAWLPTVLSKDLHYTVKCRIENLSQRRDPSKLPNSEIAASQMGRGPRPVSPLEESLQQVSTFLGPGRRRETSQTETASANDSVTSTQSWGRELMAGQTESDYVPRGQGRPRGEGFGDNFPRRGRGEGGFSPEDRGRMRFFNEFASRLRLGNEYNQRLLAIPASLNRDRLTELAKEWTKGTTTTFEKAMAIENHFQTAFKYSLQRKAAGNYIEDFLFRAQEGHCEYFATSMAMLMRALGVPARVVNGYYSVEWNDIAKAFTVRQSDAHSWVEVYFENYGWMTFDPTPPSGIGRATQESAFMVAISRVVDAIKVRWYRYVIDYGIQDQVSYIGSIFRFHTKFVEQLGNFFKSSSGETSVDDMYNGSAYFQGALALVVIVAGLAVGIVVLKRRAGRGGVGTDARKRNSVVPYYMEILTLLKRLGHLRHAAQTPREFARSLGRDHALSPFLDITEWYYAERFHGEKLGVEQSEAVRRFVEALRKQRRETGHKAR
ncbi:MAG: DUF3488 and transglutaminase-like domain-containing protein [Candidatus Sumerlaeaceae bacterium]|nr:DUF3488 and transglutaminase-like domain-containing protein [Candidatus Sumerlaeaceae bacterium]